MKKWQQFIAGSLIVPLLAASAPIGGLACSLEESRMETLGAAASKSEFEAEEYLEQDSLKQANVSKKEEGSEKKELPKKEASAEEEEMPGKSASAETDDLQETGASTGKENLPGNGNLANKEDLSKEGSSEEKDGLPEKDASEEKDGLSEKDASEEKDGILGSEITDVTEASDLNSFTEAVLELEPEETAVSENPFLNRLLIVKSEKEFDPYGAVSVIQGYENLFVLTYETAEETKEAYESLRKVPDLIVEPERLYDGTANPSETLYREKEAEPVKEAAAVLPTGRDVVAAVLDTGYDIHTYGDSYGVNRMVNGADLTAQGTIQDANGHGSIMANIILEHTPDCVKVMPVKIADESGRTSSLKLYLGIRYAIEAKADIINISMNAHKAAQSEIVEQAICEAKQAGIITVVSAGNAGAEASDYSPANVEEAIVVSAVNASETPSKETIMEYSNYGDTVDYCAYGTLQASGLNGEIITYEGTSVSAAIVSAVIAEKMAYWNSSYDELIAALDAEAKDLGDAGRDVYYGKGMLTCKDIQAPESEKKEEAEAYLPELLTCDWKNSSVEELNEWIGDSHELVVRQFLDSLTEAELQEVLQRADILQRDHIEIVCGTDGTTQYQNVDTLYNYLYSDRLEAYEVQKVISGTYYMYLQNTTRKVYLNTNKNTTKCTLNVKFSGTSTNPADNPTITISGTSAGAINLKDAKVDGVKTCTDENGHLNTICQIGITGIGVTKREHSKITGQKKTESLTDKYTDGLWGGGFTGFGNNTCSETSTSCKLMVGIGDLELAKENKTQTYQLTLTNYTYSSWSAWSDWKIIKNATCYQEGSKSHTRTKSCTNCNKKADTETATATIARLSHNFTNATWQYGTNSGIVNGERYHQCTYSCGTAGSGYDVNQAWWKKDYQYLQNISYRYMDATGKYPANYTEYINGYYTAGTAVPGWKYTETNTSEFKTAGVSSYTASNANRIYIDVPRKQYRVEYDGNGADSGSTSSQTGIYAGQVFHLRENGFIRKNYKFLGWSKTPKGEVIDPKNVKNLTYVDGGVVKFYAIWEPLIYEIQLDSQGADIEGSRAVYEKYDIGYFQDKKAEKTFEQNKIALPEKEIEDNTVLGGMRRQKFMGYYTKKGGNGDQVVSQNGELVSDIASKGNYKYFTEDSVIYANWQNVYVVQFHENLTEKDAELIEKDGIICPAPVWKEAGDCIEVQYEKAEIQNADLKAFYRFKGWSLTPEIFGEDEIILSEDKPFCTFTADEDVTLYAQWDTSFIVAFLGNGQTEGADFIEGIAAISDQYTVPFNTFAKTVEKQTMDIATGQMKNEAGESYMEEVLCSFLGWGFREETEPFVKEGESIAGSDLLAAAGENGITFGTPADDFGLSGMDQSSALPEVPANLPFVNLYAIWDEYPQILAADLYVPLADAQNGVLTESYLLGLAVAKDEELKSDTNMEGEMKPGVDGENQTSFTILDYQASDFTGAESEMMLTVTYRACDKAGNVTTKMVHIYLADTAGTEIETGKVRFISLKYADTLREDSVWRTGAYADKLAQALNNKKTGEEYTTVTPIQKAFGVKSVLKPGSGTWDHVQQIWEFSHEEVLEIQAYVETVGVGGDPSGFLERFGDCRVL